ncbi:MULTISPECIES: hypothetical protein [unclassified Streptomyces]|uniref:hypothetical protein n=1 Tax=unclassified Streptomyces TaxID=2593676 RepID=UPI002E127EDA|nr:hypothetical protein OG452_16520 [Streptomyces sp. NBC_01197]WSS50534.1 hypothetical protein OG708_19005 [Streptomyces sp. NBC_01180]
MATPTTLRGHRPSHRRPAAHRHLPAAAVAVPLVLGIVYALYTAFILSSRSPGHPFTTAKIVLSIVSGLVLAVLAFGFGRIQHALPREARAAGYGVLIGGAMGFLYSMTGSSVLSSSFIGAGFGIGALITTFYVFYTHED